MDATEIGVLATLAEELKKLQTTIDQRWIEVEDELPPNAQSVLVFYNGYCGMLDLKARAGGSWGPMIGRYDQYEAQWYPRGNWPVTHWMPLPPPPATAQSEAITDPQ